MAYLMIVDDDEDYASALAIMFRDAGHEVQTATTPETALASMRQRPPDLMILDVMFPDDSSAGFDLARAVRQESQGLKNVPILMLTAVNTKFTLGFGPQDIDEAWLPVTDFIEKGIDYDSLQAKVGKWLANANPAARPASPGR
jgi:DNA-binding response OmpR family regulator